jgi:hypothetical protein
LRVSKDSFDIDTPIETSSSRRLAGAGSCLANGACLYSRDELLRLDSESRSLSEGTFFARADVAAYQVELGGDVLPFLSSKSVVSFFDGSWTEEGHRMALQISTSDAGAAFYYSNGTSGETKLMTRNGTFLFDKHSHLTFCVPPSEDTDKYLASLDVEEVATSGDIDFSHVHIEHVESGGRAIPHVEMPTEHCYKFMAKASNLTNVSPRFTHGNAMRKLVSTVDFAKLERGALMAEVRGLMFGDNEINHHHKLHYNKGHRKLAETCMTCTYTTSTLQDATFFTHFDLWVATRMADPTFLTTLASGTLADVMLSDDPGSAIDPAYALTVDKLPGNFILELAGHKGITTAFREWTQFNYVDFAYLNQDFLMMLGLGSKSIKEADSYKGFWSSILPGTCIGGWGWAGTFQHAIPSSQIDEWCTTNYIQGGGSAMLDMLVPPSFRRNLAEDASDEDVAILEESESRRLAWYGTSGALTALKTMVTGYCDDAKAKSIEGLPIGNAYASYLYKDFVTSGGTEREYIASFQGTKAGQNMEQYNGGGGVFAWFGSSPAIVPKNNLVYFEELFECMSTMVDVGMFVATDVGIDSVYANFEPTFITGHSLGGTAATLFAKSRPYWLDPSTKDLYMPPGYPAGIPAPKLVTFGAAPTSYVGPTGVNIPCSTVFKSQSGARFVGSKSLSVSDMTISDIEVSKYDIIAGDSVDYCNSEATMVDGKSVVLMSAAGWTAYSQTMAEPCNTAPSGSVRFFHKFDPVPSIGSIASGSSDFEHNTEYAAMVFDNPSASCDFAALNSCAISVDESDAFDYGTGGESNLINAYSIKEYMCYRHGATPMTIMTKCIDKITSYQTFLHPYPCAMLITQKLELPYEEFMAKGMDPDKLQIDLGYFLVAYEDFTTCSVSWFGTVLSSMPSAVYSGDADEVAIMALAFTFAWTHSAYALYPLCVSVDSSTGAVSTANSATDISLNLMSGCVTQAQENSCYDETQSGCTIGDEVCVQICICEKSAEAVPGVTKPDYCSDEYDDTGCAAEYIPGEEEDSGGLFGWFEEEFLGSGSGTFFERLFDEGSGSGDGGRGSGDGGWGWWRE